MYVKKLQAECMGNQGSIPGEGRTFIHSNYASSRAQESDISIGDEGLFL
jgi:hypothetical protein